MQLRDLELIQVKDRNEKLNKALQLLQKNQHQAKRFKSQSSDDSWLGTATSQQDRDASELSHTDDEPMGTYKLNVALNSEQLFDTSALSQVKNNITMNTSSEIVGGARLKDSPKRNKQRDTIRFLKDRNSKNLGRSKSEWRSKEHNSPVGKSWAMKFLQPTKTKPLEEKNLDELKKTGEKKLCLSLTKTNPSKMKQALIHFNNSKDTSFRESDNGDVIAASPVIVTKNSKVVRSWAHRIGNNYNSSDKNITNETITKDDTNKTVDDIVFDFSPSKKTEESILKENSARNIEPKKLKFDSDIITACNTSGPIDSLGISTNKSDSSSVVILTPTSQDIIFLDDTCATDAEIDTMDLLGDNLEILKKYESKCIQKQQQTKDIDIFKKPSNVPQTSISNINALAKIKQEKTTQDNLLEQNQAKETGDDKPSCSKTSSHVKSFEHKNPLLSSDAQDTDDDEDFMPKPFMIKQEPESSKTSKKLSIKQRFNIDCEDCEKLINFLDKGLTDAQIQQHLDKCKRHNNPEIMRQNTPTDFWNPFILSFQADDPRNEVLIDNRFKDNKK